jgi:hypothetical protein
MCCVAGDENRSTAGSTDDEDSATEIRETLAVAGEHATHVETDKNGDEVTGKRLTISR